MYQDEFPVLEYTVQLYYSPKDKAVNLSGKEYEPILIASGILVKEKVRYYLLTCKHVFTNISSRDVVILTSLGFVVRLPEKIVL